MTINFGKFCEFYCQKFCSNLLSFGRLLTKAVSSRLLERNVSMVPVPIWLLGRPEKSI